MVKEITGEKKSTCGSLFISFKQFFKATLKWLLCVFFFLLYFITVWVVIDRHFKKVYEVLNLNKCGLCNLIEGGGVIKFNYSCSYAIPHSKHINVF